MTAVIRSELFKIRTIRSSWILVLIGVGLTVALTALAVKIDDQVTTEDQARDLLSSAALPGLFAIILGAVVGGGEYRHNTISTSLLATPNRVRFATAQVAAGALAGLAIGIVSAIVIAGITLPSISNAPGGNPLTGSETLGVLAGCIAYTTLGGAFGIAIGALLRNQTTAVVLVLVLLFMIDPILGGLVDDYYPYSLSGLAASMSGTTGDDQLAAGTAAAVWAGYTLILAAASAYLTAARDVR
jgi:ABC-2 type transport system permease protein